MKNTSAILIVVVLLVLGLFFGLKNKHSEAPATVGSANETDMGNMPMPSETENPGSEEATMPGGSVNVGVTVGAVKEFTIEAKNFSFTPNMISVKKGDKVKITFKNTAGFHDLKIDEYGVSVKQVQAPATEVLEFTADKAGTFQYYCSVGSHRAMGMYGTLKVE